MILALNSSTTQFSIALVSDKGTLVTEYSMSPGSRSFIHFMPAMDFLIKTSGIDIKEIKALSIAIGPGSFTGLRVGLSSAKGICHGLDIPIIGISSLEALANQVSNTNLPICALIDSRRGEVFAALFRNSNNQIIRDTEDVSLKFEDLHTLIKSEVIIVGNDLNKQREPIIRYIGKRAQLAHPNLWNIRASTIGYLGLRRFKKQDQDSLLDLVPSYLRPPDIKPNPYPILKRSD